jgi:hypothetical protein
MRVRTLALVLLTLGAGAALAWIVRLRSDGAAARRSFAPADAPPAIPAPALRRVLEEDARWARRRRSSSPHPGAPPGRVEVGPEDPPTHDTRGVDPESRLGEAPLVPVARSGAPRVEGR